MARLAKELRDPFFRVLVADAQNVAAEYGVRSLLTDATANPKVAKNEKIAGVMTVPLHLAPARLSGYNVCPMATNGCIAGCLHTAGNPIYMQAKTKARIARTRFYFGARTSFMVLLFAEIMKHRAKAKAARMLCGVRLNATSDIPWEAHTITISGKRFSLFDAFPDINFYDYTKRYNRLDLPANYSLTYSLAESNDIHATIWLESGRNVAAVFNIKRGEPMITAYKFGGKMWPVLDGDLHDYRPIDPRGYIVGLRAKGSAIGDVSGFVRDAAPFYVNNSNRKG